MAGSYLHVADDDGTLRSNEAIASSLENGGDVFEAVEEMYGMIWFLATVGGQLEVLYGTPAERVEHARQHYAEGLLASPSGGRRH